MPGISEAITTVPRKGRTWWAMAMLDKRLSLGPVVNHITCHKQGAKRKKSLNIVISVFSWPSVSKKETC